jgi:FMN phosphatase YigB (HAD superfamily)
MSKSGFISFLLLASLSFAVSASADQPQSQTSECDRGWVFFDIGNTIIDTHDWDHMKYMPQALDYLHAVRAAGFHVGAITNIPETWGKTEEEKMATLKASIAQNWTESVPFEWSAFDTVLIPLADVERKPAPHLFEKAKKLVQPCRIVFEGKDHLEVEAALNAGFDQGYITGKNPDALFLPIDQLLP